MRGLEEPRASFAPAAASNRSAPATPWQRRLVNLFGRVGPVLDGARSFLVSAAILSILGVVGGAILVEARRQSIVIERIEVPKALEDQQGLKGEVIAGRLVDAVADLTDDAVWRGERPAVAMGWKTADFQVPALGVSMGTVVRMVEDLLGQPDRRVSGDLVKLDQSLTLRLRISPPRPGTEPVEVGIGDPHSPAALDAAVRTAALELLRELDPLARASHLLVRDTEGATAVRGPEEGWTALVTITDAVAACLERCAPADRATAYGLWGEALRRIAARMPDLETARSLREEAVRKFVLARGAGIVSAELARREADILIELGREEEGLRRYAEAAGRYPGDVHVWRDWARRLAAAGRPQDAVEPLQTALGLRPDDAWLAFEYGMALRLAGRPGPAIESFERAADLDGRMHCAFQALGETLEQAGRIEAGRRLLDTAARLRGAQAPCVWP